MGSGVHAKKTPHPRQFCPSNQPLTQTEASGIATGSRSEYKYRRLEMPIFSGENPNGWLLRAKQFFDLHKYTKGEA